MDPKLINEILNQYPVLKKWNENYAFEIWKSLQEHQTLNEFLSTVDPKKTTDQLIKQVGYGVRIYNTKSKIRLTFDTLEKEYLDKVNKFMDSYGWYPAFIGGYMKNAGKYSNQLKYFIGKNEIEITYEAKYDQEVNISKDHFLYHITPDLKWPKIKAFGLTPKLQGKLSDHPGRIYLLKSIGLLDDFINNEGTELAFALLNSYPHKDKVKQMYILEIDMEKLSDNMKFFDDPNFDMGKAVWTYQNIPPNSIEVVGKINTTY